ncbi:alpha/beta hydrolase [Paenibacillus sp. TRM 82003]|uniref:alpha/beta fold hydrolase n=1 Tax=Kineococcus sp. TRM81007 TaxID=2925831 RepID=UPI001F59CE26|nr:alpha/beta hydrolase [Kineococcus sp. TRM81007]MCI2239335.1 alpha/beta hydrolase [Kineococcus sp. TRM81007]MCI3925019.1 alpha/beta hydrolase [Paenibacillus sp. TRM 82003]
MVLLPGTGCRAVELAAQEAALARSGRRAVPLDLPGHGAEPPVPGAATLEAVAARVGERVAALAGPGPVDLVGHSTGGVVGLLLAAHRPELLRRLVLVDSNVPVSGEAVAAKRVRAAAVRADGWHEVLVTSMRAAWGERLPRLREEVVARIAATPEAAVRRLWADVLELDPRPVLRAARVPLLHVRSTRDVDAAGLRALNPRARSADLRPLAAGHWPHLVEPDRVSALLLEFLDDGGGGEDGGGAGGGADPAPPPAP